MTVPTAGWLKIHTECQQENKMNPIKKYYIIPWQNTRWSTQLTRQDRPIVDFADIHNFILFNTWFNKEALNHNHDHWDHTAIVTTHQPINGDRDLNRVDAWTRKRSNMPVTLMITPQHCVPSGEPWRTNGLNILSRFQQKNCLSITVSSVAHIKSNSATEVEDALESKNLGRRTLLE